MVGDSTASKSPWLFFLIVFGFSWLLWVPAAFVDGDIMNSPWVVLLYLGGIGPAVGGILLTHLGKDKARRREYWRRALDPRRIGGRWYVVILLAYPLLNLAVLAPQLAQGSLPLSDTLRDMLAQPLRLIPFVGFIFLFGPFPEELGWRGYALDALQERMSALASSLVLGAVWAVWHVPLFLMNGTYQNELGLGTPAFWQFMASATVISVFFTWAYNSNRRSTLSAMLFHFSLNLTGNLLEMSAAQETIRLLLLVVLAAGVVAACGAKDLTRGKAGGPSLAG